MPRFNGTGPQGGGPMTGRGEGYCAVSQPRTGRTSGYAGLPGRSIGGFFNIQSMFKNIAAQHTAQEDSAENNRT